ncbi:MULTISPECIES: TetR family transcriptional regulator [unclassified Streptomyces]|uniref:TetR family transcriptional regulator n=1 Tax=unclassified Streptomyces TaxID=2593676 RepID=UPI001BE57640|nr:TetR family transcriptional regulator [Streptomyces sp. McG3]MBT2900190.1 TetR family transcriptional regulator [Streptomyces sp. McG3]
MTDVPATIASHTTASGEQTPAPGLRERKKQRTRATLIAAAVELMYAKGYDETTVAEIAAAAEVSTRTFFAYFPSKEDILFAETGLRIDDAVRRVTERRTGERPADALLRALRDTVDTGAAGQELSGELASRRIRLVLSTPALQAGAMRRITGAQRALTDALQRAFPDEITPPEAAAAVGALVGALVNTALTVLPDDPASGELLDAIGTAATVALRGIGTLGAPRPGPGQPAA